METGGVPVPVSDNMYHLPVYILTNVPDSFNRKKSILDPFGRLCTGAVVI